MNKYKSAHDLTVFEVLLGLSLVIISVLLAFAFSSGAYSAANGLYWTYYSSPQYVEGQVISKTTYRAKSSTGHRIYYKYTVPLEPNGTLHTFSDEDSVSSEVYDQTGKTVLVMYAPANPSFSRVAADVSIFGDLAMFVIILGSTIFHWVAVFLFLNMGFKYFYYIWLAQ